jgi:hypothetical protein
VYDKSNGTLTPESGARYWGCPLRKMYAAPYIASLVKTGPLDPFELSSLMDITTNVSTAPALAEVPFQLPQSLYLQR